MTRITISLPEDEASTLSRLAKRRGLPVSAMVREALEPYLISRNGAAAVPFAGIGRSGHKTTAREVDKILDQDWQ